MLDEKAFCAQLSYLPRASSAQFVKARPQGGAFRGRSIHAMFKHIPWAAALQRLIRSTSQSNFRPEGWCGARGEAPAFLFPGLQPALQFTVLRAFPLLQFPWPPLTRGGSNSVRASPAFSASWDCSFSASATETTHFCVFPFVWHDLYKKSGGNIWDELSVDGQHQKWAGEERSLVLAEHFCRYWVNFFWSIS